MDLGRPPAFHVNFGATCALLGGMSPLIEIDGSQGEGGGQILRTSLALSLLTGKPFHLQRVRANRPKPGLQPQHLMSVKAAAAIGRAELRGAALQSSDLEFRPGKVQAGPYRFDIGTAGATGLVLQTIYLPLALRGGGASDVILTGGTHVTASPCFHFLDFTWRRYLELMGLRVTARMARPGFYPRGGGVVEARIEPCSHVKRVTLNERGPVRVTGFSAVAGLPVDIAERQAKRALHGLRQRCELKADLVTQTWPGGPGTVLGLLIETTPVPVFVFGLGARGKRAEVVADEAVAQAAGFLRAAPAAVDAHSADQILLPLALAEGSSEYTVAEVTQHLLTNVQIIRKFLDREIVCEGEEGRPGKVRIA
jgi:RNA 3'-phosphate cyclase